MCGNITYSCPDDLHYALKNEFDGKIDCFIGFKLIILKSDIVKFHLLTRQTLIKC